MARRSPIAREKATRRRFLESAESFTPYVVAERREGTFVLPVHGAAKLFANPRRTEFVVLDRALQTLREHGVATQGGTIVDVGANIGTTVVPALVVHGFERGVAIEPDPENRKVLRASLALSELGRPGRGRRGRGVLGRRRGELHAGNGGAEGSTASAPAGSETTRPRPPT